MFGRLSSRCRSSTCQCCLPSLVSKPPPTTMATMTTLAAATMATMTTLAAATMTMTIPGPGHIHPVTDAAA